MQLVKTSRDTLLRPLQIVSGIVERRHTMPILANILIRKDGERVSFLSTDIEVQITTHANVGSGSEVAATTVAARKLLDILRALPLEDGDRIVALQNWDVSTNNAELRAMRDFAAWRRELRSVEDVGAFRRVSRNLIAPGAQPETITVAEMSPAGFRVARVQPVLGRYLLDDDDQVLPDPRSLRQPEGVHERSMTFDPGRFPWTDQRWTGRQLAGAVVY